jgi:hypothetical protein
MKDNKQNLITENTTDFDSGDALGNSIAWNVTSEERALLADLDVQFESDDRLICDLAGLLAEKAGASPAMVFACKVMGTVLTADVLAELSFEDHHRVAEALALFETYGEVAWCFVD